MSDGSQSREIKPTEEARIAFEPLAPKAEPQIPADLLPALARRLMREFRLDSFRAVVNGYIKQGFVSEQDIVSEFDRKTLNALKDPKSNPSPAKCRKILSFLCNRCTTNPPGEKIRWRHANPRPREDRAPQPL